MLLVVFILIRPYLSNIIKDHKTKRKWEIHPGNIVIDYKTQGEWKIQLPMVINFISSKDSDKIHTMCTKSRNIEVMMGSETNDIIKELFESLLQKYQ